MKNRFNKAVSWWQEQATDKATDTKRQKAYRRFIRIGGIVLLFLISPILVIAIVFLAFITV